MYEKVKHFYELGLYTAEMVWNFVLRGKITEAEYHEIVGE